MPNEKVLETKKAQVAGIVEALKAATTGVLMDYRGLTVEEDTKLRNDLRAAGVKYFVVKNTLLRLAANQVGLEELDSILHGPTALAVSEDPVAPAKILFEFAKNNDKVEIKSGFMDGKVLSEDELMRLAKTPSKDTLIAKIMGSLNAPVSNLARLLSTIAEGGVEIADLIAKKNGEATEEVKEEKAPEVAEAPTEEAKAPEAAEAVAEEKAPEVAETAEQAEEEKPSEEEKPADAE
ncbi:MAG: 50S ribosomal protein L10 [Clostridia bacterium]|nr:50S ribosomal protein L10 [Clostridia bacterium]